MGGKLVTSAASFGRLITEIDLTIDRKAGTITAAKATNQIVTQDVKPDPKVQAIVDKYVKLSAPLANQIVGTIADDILSARDTPSGQNDNGEQPMGDVIADAMLDATKAAGFGASKAAFMNSGGVRAGLLRSQISGGEQPGQVTYGEAFNVQPFGNTLVVKTCTGQQIYDVLNQQFNNPSAGRTGSCSRRPTSTTSGQRRIRAFARRRRLRHVRRCAGRQGRVLPRRP